MLFRQSIESLTYVAINNFSGQNNDLLHSFKNIIIFKRFNNQIIIKRFSHQYNLNNQYLL